LIVLSGKSYRLDPEHDGLPDPLLMIGTQVFGVQALPFLTGSRGELCTEDKTSHEVSCHFDVIAPTDALRTAETFYVRDLRWAHFAKSGDLEFQPAFTTIKSMVPPPKKKTRTCLLIPVISKSPEAYTRLADSASTGFGKKCVARRTK
jgi:hypothetical protein